MPSQAQTVEAFLSRWHGADGSELANAQSFTRELCELLELGVPDPAHADTRDNAYVFERRVIFNNPDGTTAEGRIDCYRRGAFVLENKKLKQGVHTKAFGLALLAAHKQAEQYARALPSHEGRPPFLLVVDVGNVIDVYAEFSRSGATYTPFPDPRSYRIKLADLRDAKIRERLRAIWLDPMGLDPARQSAKVTREIAAQLAGIAKALEAAQYSPHSVGNFLTRCLFTFFAEDVGLLPKRAFTDLLESLVDKPKQFVPMLRELWTSMDTGGFSTALRMDVLQFNGKLFREAEVLPLDRDQIALLLEAGKKDWAQVEPAIFGTLLERALDPEERHALGAHYTPRAYVERLVLPTVIEPLREEWSNTQAAALNLATEGNTKAAEKVLREFHHRLCSIRVLDPACGSGNFLYVTLEHMKRLEGEVMNQLHDLNVSLSLETEGLTVDPHQFLGIELNPRAASIAEMVLWVGYLQWHFRTKGSGNPPQPVLRDFRNIENRDAVLSYDRMEYELNQQLQPVTSWDGKTYKRHPVTGEDVPDETARLPIEKYINPRRAEWPEADFVVGNPPFLGKGEKMRAALGDGYVDALRHAWSEMPDSADFVMLWWDMAAAKVRAGRLQRFGLITTNSLKQAFNRRVLETHLSAKEPVHLAFAIPDHPWVDNAGGASVRIAMTVVGRGDKEGVLTVVTAESSSGGESPEVSLASARGKLHADLRIGANVASACALRSNEDITSMGVMLAGAGFILDEGEARGFGYRNVKPFKSGSDLTKKPKPKFVIDFCGMKAEEALRDSPDVYQHVLNNVKPERDANRDKGLRQTWWLHGRTRPLFRSFIDRDQRYIATTETSKFRFFQFLPSTTLLDHSCIAFGMSDAFGLGVLSSRIHVTWALAAGGRLGVGNDPRYNKTRCFEPFPFPTPSDAPQMSVRALAEQLDAHRKKQQQQHPDLTLTGMYNVLEKLKTGEALTAKEKVIHEQGLISVLKQLHDELDLAVLEAYGWSDLAPRLQIVNGNAPAGTRTRDDVKRELDEVLLERLVALNSERAAEEQRGLIRWLRPEYQNPQGKAPEAQRAASQAEMDVETEEIVPVAAAATKLPWPKGDIEQVKAVASVLANSKTPLRLDAIAAHFSSKGPWKKRLPGILDMLVAVGRVRVTEDQLYVAF